MIAKKILYPTDFSTTGDVALAYATSLARDSGATLLILHVEEPPLAYGAGEMYAGPAMPDRDELERMLATVVPPDPAVSHEHRMVTGDAARRIVEVAEHEGVDLIVMGTHGRTGLSRLLMGSVAESVVRQATCPVFTLKQPQTADEPAE